MDDEPTEMDDELEERLYNARAFIDYALLSFENDRHELIPTAIEELYYKIYNLLIDFCVKE